jgi:hypothetical protein
MSGAQEQTARAGFPQRLQSCSTKILLFKTMLTLDIHPSCRTIPAQYFTLFGTLPDLLSSAESADTAQEARAVRYAYWD